MGMPPFLRRLRDQIGHAPVLLPSVAAVVRNDDGHVLCLLRADTGDWSLPSGICEPGEAPAHTITRELREETGIVARPERVLAVLGDIHVEYPNGDIADYVSTLFECRWLSGTPEAADEESIAVGFFPPDHLPPIRVLDQTGIDLSSLDGPEATFAWDDAWLDA